MRSSTATIPTPGGSLRLILLRPREQQGPVPGILWIHGGGYSLGMAEMVHASCGKMLAERFGAVVVSPDYRLAGTAPFPAALEDCYAALAYMHVYADELGIDRSRIIVGGESAGGGLAVATCLLARDVGDIPVAFQIPLYPMLDCRATPTSLDNHGKVWNTKRNRWGWRRYLGALADAESIPAYASPAHAADYAGLPPCYTFVSEGEPFLYETRAYVQKLQQAGVPASMDVYPGDVHAFDMLTPMTSQARQAKQRLCEVYETAVM